MEHSQDTRSRKRVEAQGLLDSYKWKSITNLQIVQGILTSYLERGILVVDRIPETPASKINIAKIREMRFKESGQLAGIN